MTLFRLPDAWVWDFWIADDGEQYHLFFLRASRALIDPGRRHDRAYVGHAVSPDLRNWSQVADAFLPSDGPAFDDLAIWTGSVVRGSDGLWRFFYTASSRAEQGLIQRIGLATSPDLHTWHRHDTPVVEADGRWYERLGDSSWPDQAWRDPWVLADPNGNGWHMLITSRANHGPEDDRGVVGHAFSTDLVTWEVGPPLSAPGAGFGQLEVPQVEIVDGKPVLLFSCLKREMAPWRQTDGVTGGTWIVEGQSLLGPWPIHKAQPLTGDELYSGRIIKTRDNEWRLLAFLNRGPTGEFIGELSDPLPLSAVREHRELTFTVVTK
jgi:beta-fructofuranosidase